MTRREAIDLCLTLPGAYEDYPFASFQEGPESWAALRHRGNRKVFAFVMEYRDRPCVNLKAEPMPGDFWRRVHPGTVIPAYHMNKVHWNTVFLDGGLSREELVEMIRHSFDRTRPRRKTAPGSDPAEQGNPPERENHRKKV